MITIWLFQHKPPGHITPGATHTHWRFTGVFFTSMTRSQKAGHAQPQVRLKRPVIPVVLAARPQASPRLPQGRVEAPMQHVHVLKQPLRESKHTDAPQIGRQPTQAPLGSQ